ncbi:MAG: ADP-ribosylglycohydrolase family protein [Treponema sp.]|jgi:ADP-ribosylglycohydrolase|nr:ADP-ribosylglycohydrolase family protein [Treponema sp.]
MKAWEYTYRKTQNAIPVILSEEDQTWLQLQEIEKSADTLLRAQWSSSVPGSAAPESVIAGAVQSMENMGYTVDEAELILEAGLKALEDGDLQKLNILSARLYRLLDALPVNPRSPYWNFTLYNDFESHQSAVSFPDPVPVNNDDFYDRTYAAWLCRLSGGALGTALEGYTTKQLRKKFGEIRGYIREPNTYNDDITYEIAFLEAFVQNGPLLGSADIAEQWLALVPSGWSAEQIALDNLRRGIYPPESGSRKNPYREWIGAQMRGAVCGQLSPGNPREAARLAWLDGVVSHTGNGVLGETFNAMLVSLAFVEEDIRCCLDRVIALIPADSEYYSVIRFAREQAGAGDFESAWSACEDRFKQYNWIHAYPNAAAEVLALWFGNGDFDETMHLIAMCGQDVDCNAAQIAAVLGAWGGSASIAERWYRPLGNTILTYLRNMKKIELDYLVRQTVKAAAFTLSDTK